MSGEILDGEQGKQVGKSKGRSDMWPSSIQRGSEVGKWTWMHFKQCAVGARTNEVGGGMRIAIEG